jgi:phage baseplate assembly protein V
MWAELKRLIDNIASVGTISETQSAKGKALARVKLLKRTTAFYPILSFSNTFKRHFIPARVGEQVLVIHPFGEASVGFIIRGIFNKGRKEHSLSNDHTEVIDFEDGTVITYDTQAKELKINASDKITIICKAAKVTAETVDVVADSVKIDSGSIDLGDGGKGIVTGECLCAFTGTPHSDISSKVRAVK